MGRLCGEVLKKKKLVVATKKVMGCSIFLGLHRTTPLCLLNYNKESNLIGQLLDIIGLLAEPINHILETNPRDFYTYD